jgi:hypothetical protein
MNAAAQRPRSRYVPSVVSGDRVVGLIDLSIRSRPLGAAEFGYAVHDCWGQGIATAAGRLVTDHAFRSLGIRTIHATCDATNIASVRVLEKLGMRPDATLRRHIWLGDRWRDTHVFPCPPHRTHHLRATPKAPLSGLVARQHAAAPDREDSRVNRYRLHDVTDLAPAVPRHQARAPRPIDSAVGHTRLR